MGALKTRTLGKSGMEVTEIGMGLWAAGGEGWGPTDDRAVLDAIDVALDVGVNFFDTSDVYGVGHSEELLGQAMRGRRDRFIVASKIGWQGFDRARGRSAFGDLENAPHLQRRWQERLFDVTEGLAPLAEAKGCSMSQLALAWCMQQPGVTSPIIGPRTMDQLEDNLGALEVTIDDNDQTTIDELVPRYSPGR